MEDLNFHWTNGRNLSSITYTDDNNEVATLISFKYDDNGIRVSKTYGDTTTYYTTINGTITSQYELDENDNPINVIEFIYDSNDEIIGFTYQNDTYFYIKNIQGDITNIVDNTGNVLVNYYYDAWGVPYSDDLSNNNLAEINPMRYRGYYYDCEMGLYYLQSRYYIPTFCRFLNSDLPEYAQVQKDDYAGTNLFAYCSNNPVNNSDPTGYFSLKVYLIAAMVAGVIGAVAKMISNYSLGYRGAKVLKGVAGSALGNAVDAVVLMALIRVRISQNLKNIIAAFAASAVQVIIDYCESLITKQRRSIKGLTFDFILNTASYYMGNYIGSKAIKTNNGWFQAKYVKSFFTGSYGKRINAQVGLGSAISAVITRIKDGLSEKYGKGKLSWLST